MSKADNLIGLKFGRLKVVERAPNSKTGKTRWACQCDCGNPNLKIVFGCSLKSGRTKSCGCLARETKVRNGKKNITHGETHTRLYKIWCGMRSRCNYPKNIEYHNYGGRGITYCKEWETYELFRDWALNNGYQKYLTLERIDCDKNYCPENCKWATMKEQQNNRRNTVRFVVEGVEHSVSEWSEISGIAAPTLVWRLKNGWNENEMFMPVNLNNKNIRKQKESNL